MTGRNELCPCLSGIKYKKCCGKSVTKGGKFAPKPSMDKLMGSPEYVMGNIQRVIWMDLHTLGVEEIIRREAIRTQQFR
jgi:uncharacterized protein YchJ